MNRNCEPNIINFIDLNDDSPKTDKEQFNSTCSFCRNHEAGDTLYESSDWDGGIGFDYIRGIKYCPLCGRKLRWKFN